MRTLRIIFHAESYSRIKNALAPLTRGDSNKSLLDVIVDGGKQFQFFASIFVVYRIIDNKDSTSFR